MENKLKTIDIKDIHNLSKSEILRLIACYVDFNDSNAYESKDNDADNVFKYMIDIMGFNALPKVVADEEFEKIKGAPLYRGVKEIEHFANYLCDHNYHYGTGYTNGTFASTKRDVASGYTNESHQFDPILTNEYIMTLKLDNPVVCHENDVRYYFDVLSNEVCPKYINGLFDSTIGKFEHYLTSNNKHQRNLAEWIIAIKEFLDTLETESERKWFLAGLDLDISKFAVLLGYDAMKTNTDTYTIFNRGKVIVSQSELERVTKNSKRYNSDQTINFENQPNSNG